MSLNPTSDTYKTLTLAYEFFNAELFENKLSPCLITMQRKGKARGYFCPERFEARKENSHHIHEIALNPALFRGRSDEDIVSTLVHEMAHVWQEEHGDPPRRNYHDREWGKKMEEIGLIPSATGEVDGHKTGSSMSHYINPEGKYAQLIKVFFAKNQPMDYQDRPTFKPSPKKNKVKYTCPTCGLNAWGKLDLNLMCGAHKMQMKPNET